MPAKKIPYKKKAQARTRTYRKGRFRKAYKKYTIAKTPNQYFYKRRALIDSLLIVDSVAAVAPYGWGKQFLLTNIPGYTEFTSLYDQYRIHGVLIEFVTDMNCYFDGGVGGPRIHTILDYDDSNTPANLNEVLERQNVRMHTFTASRVVNKRMLYPKVAKSVYGGPVTTGYEAAKPGWIDCTNAGIPHYGIKAWVEPHTYIVGTRQAYISVYATFYVSFKNVR